MIDKILYYYADDEELINQYHVLAPTDIETAAEDTLVRIRVAMSQGAIAYFFPEFYAVISGRYLFAWAIRKEFRATHKKEFLDFILPRVDSAAVYYRNQRARLFLRANGFTFEEEVQPEEGESYLILRCR